MANTGGFYSFIQSSSDGLNLIEIGWTSGATGALPSSYPSGFIRATPEIKSVTRTGTGAFTFALGSPWYATMFGLGYTIVQATWSATGARWVDVVEDHSTNVTTPEIKILISNAAGAVDPASGDVVNLTFGLCIKPSY
jgi:hypothetical protein